MLSSTWTALFAFALSLPVGFCITTEYTINIGTQATIVGYQYDYPAVRQFAGIPYAQSPADSNRFMPTQRKDPSGQIHAFQFGSMCFQPHPVNGTSEDCLFLNIFTPVVDNMPQQKYPVYFFIHGGGFQSGSGNFNYVDLATSFTSNGIIVVSINYRLNVFGFFSTRDSVIPGNMGLLDQIEALNWVKRYISYFGGDPNKITVGGVSAGSMSVSLLTLSPKSQNLFQGAILESGSGFSTGFFSATEHSNSFSKILAVKLGCITAENWDAHNLVQMVLMRHCLQIKTAQEIQAERAFVLPVMDGPGGVIPDRLEVLAQSRPPIPILIGNNHDEYFYFNTVVINLHKDEYVSVNPSLFLANDSATYLTRFTRQSETEESLHSIYLKYYNNSAMVGQAMKAAYVDSSNMNDQDHIGWAKLAIQLGTELIFIGPTYRDANLYRQTKSPVYLWSFDYLAPDVMPKLDPGLRDSAVMHGWEMLYIYWNPGYAEGGWHVTSDDLDTKKYCVSFWTNFIKYGNPTPAPATIVWPPMGANMEYMSLGPRPTPFTGFHSKSKFFACDVPAIEGVSQSWCQ